MRRMVSLVWNDIMKIQTIGNMKKITTSVSATPRRMRSSEDVCSMPASYASPRARSRSRSQFLMKMLERK